MGSSPQLTVQLPPMGYLLCTRHILSTLQSHKVGRFSEPGTVLIHFFITTGIDTVHRCSAFAESNREKRKAKEGPHCPEQSCYSLLCSVSKASMQNTLPPSSQIQNQRVWGEKAHSIRTRFVCMKDCASLLSFYIVILLPFHNQSTVHICPPRCY